MNRRAVIERFKTIDENGETVVVTKRRNFERTQMLDGTFTEYEKLPDLSVDGLGTVGSIDETPYELQIMRTGMKLRMP